MSEQIEPQPLWATAPRYCPSRAFPAYRFVPGRNAHPTRQSEGHSYGRPKSEITYLPPESWQENTHYLFGIDLYHQGYLWESHEVWEELWHLTNKKAVEAQFLQGLIQNSAAQLKRHLSNLKGTVHLSREAYRRFSVVFDHCAARGQKSYMGLRLTVFLKEFTAHYRPFWEGLSTTDQPAPHLHVSELADSS